jgi:hypothetical protein
LAGFDLLLQRIALRAASDIDLCGQPVEDAKMSLLTVPGLM